MYKIIGADQKEYGPVSVEELRLWIQHGRADGRTLAKAEGTDQWKPLATFPDFAGVAYAGSVPPIFTTASSVVTPANYTAQVLAQPTDFGVADCLGQAWRLWMSNFWLLFVASLLIGVSVAILRVIPFAGLILGGVLYGGLYLVYLKRIRGEPASVGEAFSGFSLNFMQLLLVGVVAGFLAGLGWMICMVPGLYLFIAWRFAVPLVIDRRLEFWTAMELSRQVVTRVWPKVFALTVISFAPFVLCSVIGTVKSMEMAFAGMNSMFNGGAMDPGKLMELVVHISRTMAPFQLLTVVVLIFNLPFAVGAQMYAYEALFGPRPNAS